jgi:hypothetical protein
LHVFALAYAFGHSSVWRGLARVPGDFVLTQMGRHSLPVFVIGSLLSMLGWMLPQTLGDDKMIETVMVGHVGRGDGV